MSGYWRCACLYTCLTLYLKQTLSTALLLYLVQQGSAPLRRRDLATKPANPFAAFAYRGTLAERSLLLLSHEPALLRDADSAKN
jgi:hypothetical protein